MVNVLEVHANGLPCSERRCNQCGVVTPGEIDELPAGIGPHALGARMARWTRRQLEALVERHLPGFALPRVFAGFAVGADVRADLAYTIGLLDACGEGTVCATPALESLARVLRPIDGAATHTFASYRVAETLRRFGPFAGNPLLAALDDAERDRVAAACDSTSWCALLEQGRLPANYAAVLARCEHARGALGLATDPAVLGGLVERVRDLLTRNPAGWHDDSPRGAGRFDIYLADLLLFLEPLARDPGLSPELAGPWRRSVDAALDLVALTAARSGAAFAWGRSTGALAVCLTIELGALAVARGLTTDPDGWLGRAARAFACLAGVGGEAGWFATGLVTAHVGRSPYSYRGPQRRLQMTLDTLGKVAWSAMLLRDAADGSGASDRAASFPEHDALVDFAASPRAALWTHRSRALSFVLPLVGATLNDYLAAPQCPGFLEVPVEVPLPTGVPFAVRHERAFVPGGAPDVLEHGARRLAARWGRWPRAGEWECTDETPALDATRDVVFEVRDATLVARERLSFAEVPDALALQVAESARRRLRVRFSASTPHAVTTIETAGVKEYRSFWGELPRVHQVDVTPAPEVEIEWSVAPVWRVVSSAKGHHYDRCLYEPLRGRVVELRAPPELFSEPEGARGFLRDVDLFHLHWPEWTTHDVDVQRRLIAVLRECGVRVVWTQHNLVPHSRDERLAGSYALWAEAADGVIHHSRCGEVRSRERHRFRADAVHALIPHPHFGHLMSGFAAAERAGVERELGLAPCAIRLGVVGAPRPEKDTALVLEAFAACRRDDLGLLVLSLRPDERAPTDPRITALPYEMVAREVYDRRLRAIDALVFPIRPGDLLTSGVVGDAVGAALPAIVSDWPYLAETLGDAAIVYGRTREDLTACLDALDPSRLDVASAAAAALRADYAPERVAEMTLALLDRVGSTKL